MSQIRLRSIQNEKRKTFKISLFLIHIGHTPKLQCIAKFAALGALLVVRYQLEPKITKGKCSKCWRGGKSSVI